MQANQPVQQARQRQYRNAVHRLWQRTDELQGSPCLQRGMDAYLDGEYCENHFYIGLEQRSLPVSPTFMQSVAYLLAGACNKGQPHH